MEFKSFSLNKIKTKYKVEVEVKIDTLVIHERKLQVS